MLSFGAEAAHQLEQVPGVLFSEDDLHNGHGKRYYILYKTLAILFFPSFVRLHMQKNPCTHEATASTSLNESEERVTLEYPRRELNCFLEKQSNTEARKKEGGGGAEAPGKGWKADQVFIADAEFFGEFFLFVAVEVQVHVGESHYRHVLVGNLVLQLPQHAIHCLGLIVRLRGP